MTRLLPFLFNTIRKRAIDPSNKRFFLPVVLENADGSNSKGKLLPIEEQTWSIGPIGGAAGSTVTSAFTSNWATYLQKVQKLDMSSQYPIANPKTPNPVLTMGGAQMLVVDGLENLFVEPNPVFTPITGGYQVAATLQMNYWDGSAGRPTYPMLSINGPYNMKQSLCTANKLPDGTFASTCNGNAATDIDGGGTVNLQVLNAFVDVVFTLTVKDGGSAGRTPLLSIKSLLFRGPDAATPPTLNVVNLTIDASVSPFLVNAWKTLAENALTSPDGEAGLFSNLNASLNQPANLTPLSNTLTEKLTSALDGLFGKESGALPTVQPTTTVNPVDRYLFDRVRFGLNSPASPMFLPLLLCQNKNPSLSPLDIAQVNLPPINILGIDIQDAMLKNLHVIGLTNVQAAPGNVAISDTDELHFTGVLGGWNPPPRVSCPQGIPAPPAKGTANFSLTPPGSPTLTGSVDLTVTATDMVGICNAQGADDSDLAITFNSLKLTTSNPVASIQIVLDIDSAFKTMINDALKTQNILDQILAGLNSQIAGDLKSIGEQVTAYARQAIQSNLS